MTLAEPMGRLRGRLRRLVARMVRGHGHLGLTAWFRARSPLVRFAIVVAAVLACLRLLPVPPLLAPYDFSRSVYDRNGTLLRLTISSDDQYRIRVPIVDISKQMRTVMLFREDRWFYFHPGVNPVSLARAFWGTYVRGTTRTGASTITMQTARMLYGLETKTVPGKLRQIAAAIWMELTHGKGEIFEAYLNLVPFGYNVQGVEAASVVYFRRRAKDLDLSEAITLATVPKNPQRYRPSGGENEDLQEARKKLLTRWLRARPQDKLRVVGFSELATRLRSELPFRAPHFAEHVIHLLPRGGNVSTTLDLPLQTAVEAQLHTFVQARRQRGIDNAAALLIDYEDMEVRAWIGSASYHDQQIEGQVNGVLARRSPGSTLKPFVYALAFDQGLAHPMTMLKDTPTSFGDYAPENFDREFAGPVFARDALNRSRNIPAVRLASELSRPDLYDLLVRARIGNLNKREHYQLAVVLGAAEVTMTELVSMYAALANGGALLPLHLLSRDSRESHVRRVPSVQLFSREAAFLTLDILKDNPSPMEYTGEGRAPVFWKTGTSISFRDAWSVGIFDRYVLAVWVGSFDSRSNPAYVGRTTAGPLFFQIVEAVRAAAKSDGHTNTGNRRMISAGGLPPEQRLLQAPPGVSRVTVCAVSGALPNRFCPTQAETYFIPGRTPITRCAIHREVVLDPLRGQRLCGRPRADQRVEVFEFWPSDLALSFERAGIPRKEPPEFAQECVSSSADERGLGPTITRPLARVTYAQRIDSSAKQKIPFSASADGGVRRLFWFVDDAFVGETAVEAPFFWEIRPGSFVVRVIDDRGRTASRELVVEVAR